MNKASQKLLWRSGRFLQFLMDAKTRHSIHSPFLFNFIEEVIRNNSGQSGLDKVEDIRRQCLASREIMLKSDYGRGAVAPGKTMYPVRVSKIARTSVTPRRQAIRMYQLVKFLQADRILELGTSLGITTAYLALANQYAKIITIEGCPESAKRAKEHFKKLGIENVEVLQGRFEEMMGEAFLRLGHADVVYIDGDHRKESVLANFERCLPFTNNETVIILDDIHATRDMEEAWRDIISREDVRISIDFFRMGWVFFRKESSKEHFRLRYL